MMNETIKQAHQNLPAGKIEVAPRAIANISALSVVQIDGVVGTTVYPVHKDGVQILSPQDAYKGVDVHIHSDEVTIEVYILLAYGSSISEITDTVQKTVCHAIEQALNTPVAHVHVRVQGVR
ncbi:MAG: Asp23/Gls24 family envelope stress response protein [Chloroflexota bacterium]